MCIARHTQNTQNEKFTCLCNSSENVRDEVDFLPTYKHESILQIDSITLVDVASHAQSTQNNKFAISLQYLKKNVKDEINF